MNTGRTFSLSSPRAFVVTLMMALALALALPGAAFATEYEVANANSLTTAISSASDGDTVKLTENISVSSYISLAKAITLDLNGHTLERSDGWLLSVDAAKEITIKNGTAKGGVVVGVDYDGAKVTVEDMTIEASTAAVYIKENAEVTLKNVTASTTSTKVAALRLDAGKMTVESGTYTGATYGAAVFDTSELVVNGGTISGTGIGISGNNQYGGTTITVSGGTISGGEAGIYHPQSGTLTLNGGTITGKTGVQMCAGTLKIPSSSTVSVTGTGTDARPSASGQTVEDGAAISLINRTGYQGTPASATIAGGTFTSSTEAVAAYSMDSSAASEWSSADSSVNVSGGSFSTPVADALLAEGHVNTSSDGSTFTPGSKDGMVEVKIEEELSEGKTATVYFSTKEAASTYTSTHEGTESTTVLKYTLTFDSQGGSAVDSQTLKVTINDTQTGEKTTKPADPTRDGYVFKGWYTEAACTNEFTFGNELKKDTTVYAKWTAMHTVTFINEFDNTTTTVTVVDGEKVSKPEDPTCEGYTFENWFTDKKATKAYDFSSAVTSNITLYAGFNKNKETSSEETTDSGKTSKTSSALPKTGDTTVAYVTCVAVLGTIALAGATALRRHNQ